MNTQKLAEIVIAKLPLLSLPATELTSELQIRTWLAAAFKDTETGFAFRKTWPKDNADKEAECFWRVLKWHFSPGNLSGLFAARMLCREAYPKAETLASIIAVLSGQTPAVNAWQRALYGR